MMQKQMEIEKKYSQCGDYNIIETLGSGYHAKVKLAEKDGRKVAIKIFKKNHDTASNIKALANEINILKLIHHPNIINLIEFGNDFAYRRKNGQVEPRVCMVLELASGGELFEFVASSGRFTPEASRYYFKQFLSALIFMENKGVCHRDLKLENVLLDENFNLKIADFGFAKLMEAAKLSTNLGSSGYMAPEILLKIQYNGTKADIFSTGVIMFILHFGSPPFSEATKGDHFYKFLIAHNSNQFWNLHKGNKQGHLFTEDFMNLMEGMLAPDPDKRFTLAECFSHPWTNGPMATPQQIQNEFKIRLTKIKAEIQATKMKLKAQKANAQKNPVGKFRSIIGETEHEDFKDTIEKHNLDLEKKILNNGRVTGLPNEILLYQDPNFVFCYLLKHCDKFNSKVTKIHETKYKINFELEESLEEKVGFQVEILDCENEMIKLNITKLSGNYLEFKEISSRMIKTLQENYKEYLDVEIQQQ